MVSNKIYTFAESAEGYFSTLSSVGQEYYHAIKRIISEPALRRLVLLPHLFGILSFFIALCLVYPWRDTLRELLFGRYNSFHHLVNASSVLLFAGFIGLLTVLAALDFSARAIMKRSLAQRGFQPKQHAHWVRATGREVIELLVRLVLLSLLGILFLTTILIPGLNVITLLLFSAFLGADQFGMSLSCLDVSLRGQVAIIKDHPLEVWAVGGALLLSMSMPFVGILFVPLSSVVAAERICRWIQAGDVSLVRWVDSSKEITSAKDQFDIELMV